ncbi:hypothetical protein PUNSTDRAFT_136061 [Punctularia strigosozonata HHB-11173 SS5]|uniref:uncharacterized protein n=1 Tax=Punctularia strigosozonata (strain HHB-11173) TaxID=741275 RepID=UPI000441655B|nr:uncharacterized protein PUNSTDRAFT_136061 [Punctularia strigosozonata HHB-11173 SS5]EIN07378.1 hypothetical protein PUNSTDRAFT_136061 [Punctularia strigosozonata HHB-11173 SS5]
MSLARLEYVSPFLLMLDRTLAILIVAVTVSVGVLATPAPQLGILPPDTLPCSPQDFICTQVDSVLNCCDGSFCDTSLLGTVGTCMPIPPGQ